MLYSAPIQEKISNKVMNIKPSSQKSLVSKVVTILTKELAELMIDIPNIVFIPSRDVTYGFSDFDLKNLESLNLQPVSKELLIRELRTHKSIFLTSKNEYVKYLCEPKKASEMQNPIVLKKREAAVQWCCHATRYAATYGGKKWYYVFIPHDAIKANSSFGGLCAEFTIAESILESS